jgi:hypothetical protein
MLRELERQGLEGKLTTAGQVYHEAHREFQRIRDFLQSYLGNHSDLVSKP